MVTHCFLQLISSFLCPPSSLALSGYKYKYQADCITINKKNDIYN
ncbi:hypothetical protein V1477_010886 [Vespula maculifrons]|uniref:Uncharacterized protein n=1 Tax=Vespula maculifrons TaxID=7453 RepID=A0ABD2C374_VESMC